MGARITVVACLLVAAVSGGMAAAQDAAAPVRSPILTLDQDAMYLQSMYGKALRARIAEETAKLEEESRRIDAELEAEERDLTQKRTEMTAEDFAPLAAAFDKKAQELRAKNAAAIEALRIKEQAGRKEFFTTASEILGDFMIERGAAAILDKGAVIFFLNEIDVTDEVIARLDALLGDGTKK